MSTADSSRAFCASTVSLRQSPGGLPMATDTRQMTIDQEMYERMAGSSALYDRAKETFPSGVTHDARFAKPFPIYVSRAQGSRKWDVDGNEYVDYYGGHGALILGHCHPVVTQAALEQVSKG